MFGEEKSCFTREEKMNHVIHVGAIKMKSTLLTENHSYSFMNYS